MRKGTKRQVRDYDIARRELNRNAEWERAHGVREETKKYLRLNNQVIETEKPLSVWQRMGSGIRLDREDRQDRRTARRERRMDSRGKRVDRRFKRLDERGERRSERMEQRKQHRDARGELRYQRRESSPAPRARAGRTTR